MCSLCLGLQSDVHSLRKEVCHVAFTELTFLWLRIFPKMLYILLMQESISLNHFVERMSSI